MRRNLGSLSSLSLCWTAIEKLPYSIGYLTKLDSLSLDGCKSLKSLPGSIFGLKSLQYFSFTGCSNLDIGEKIEEMEHLEELHLSRIAITKVPSSIDHLKHL